jgi:hypothetical protein
MRLGWGFGGEGEKGRRGNRRRSRKVIVSEYLMGIWEERGGIGVGGLMAGG